MSSSNQPKKAKSESGNSSTANDEKPRDEKQTSKILPSYTSMIAQAILSKSTQRSTLSEIYEFMERRFLPLREKGNGWRNCVRHTLSLSDCFLKLHRPENGRSCHWAIHPSYLARFVRGDYRKRRQSRSRRANQTASNDQYPYQQMVYDREASGYNNRMMHMNTASVPNEMMDRHRHYPVPPCSGMPPYSHVTQGHGYQHHQQSEPPGFYHGQYNREYKAGGEVYHQYIHSHNSNYQ